MLRKREIEREEIYVYLILYSLHLCFILLHPLKYIFHGTLINFSPLLAEVIKDKKLRFWQLVYKKWKQKECLFGGHRIKP